MNDEYFSPEIQGDHGHGNHRGHRNDNSSHHHHNESCQHHQYHQHHGAGHAHPYPIKHEHDCCHSCCQFGCERPVNVTVNLNIPCYGPGTLGGGSGTGSGSGGTGGGKGGGSGGSGSGPGSGSEPGRPTHQTGATDGSITKGAGGKGGIISIPSRPPTQWPGTRSQMYLPFLAIRAWPGDTAKRPVQGPFWESPDIFITPNVTPANAPATPPKYGDTAQAGAPNTVYAHVWNLGQAPAHGALVEFYWINPFIGINDKDHAPNLIGITYVDLGPRHGTSSHKLVKCPVNWQARFENGGHECLIVRVSHPAMDPLSNPPWDASQNRHIGQRNIHVKKPGEDMPTIPITIGRMYGETGKVQVNRANTDTMPWLHLVTQKRDQIPATATADGFVGVTAPTAIGRPLPALNNNPDPQGTGGVNDSHDVPANDNLQVGFVTTDSDPAPNMAHVYRVSGTQNGQIFGGYTVVVLGS